MGVSRCCNFDSSPFMLDHALFNSLLANRINNPPCYIEFMNCLLHISLISWIFLSKLKVILNTTLKAIPKPTPLQSSNFFLSNIRVVRGYLKQVEPFMLR